MDIVKDSEFHKLLKIPKAMYNTPMFGYWSFDASNGAIRSINEATGGTVSLLASVPLISKS